MKLTIYIFLFINISCFQNNKTSINNINTLTKNNVITQQYPLKPLKLGGVILYWDSSKKEIVKDKNYFKILNDNNKVLMVIEDITNTSKIDDYICSKKTSLKVGDIAYIFLNKSGLIGNYECLNIQFDIFDNCIFPEGLLDYIENNRKTVKEVVKNCYRKRG